jgi:hypothetical protein
MTRHTIRLVTIPYADGTRDQTEPFELDPNDEIVDVARYADCVILTLIRPVGPFEYKAATT